MARSTSPSISVSRRGSAAGDIDRAVVWVRGEHDVATSGSLAVAIARAGQLDDGDVLVDLSEVTFMDAATIGAIVGSANRLRSHSQALGVRRPSLRALRVLDLCGLAHLVRPDVEPAVHPTGVAAALSTWIAVPPSAARPRRGRTVATERAVREPSRSTLAVTTPEADRRES